MTTANPRPDGESHDAAARGKGAAPTNVIVLANDATLLEVLRHALDRRQRVWRANDAMHAADLLIAAQSGVLFVDVAVTGAETPELVDSLHAQFPDLPIVVAGRRDDELSMGRHISSGAVFRFLHKPVSAERVRLFIDAAARRAGPIKPPGAMKREFRGFSARSFRLPTWRVDRTIALRLGRALGLLGLALGLLWGVSEVAERRPWQQVTLPSLTLPSLELPSLERPQRGDSRGTGTPSGQQSNDLPRLLGAAGIALSQGRLSEPEGQNAIELYRAVLLRDPGNPTAREGLARTASELLNRAEQALLAEDLGAAASALDSARSADPSNPRLDFLSAQLQRESERVQVAATVPQRSAAADRAVTEQTGRLLTLADARMKQGRLAGSADAAEAYVLAARDLQPDDPGVRQALNALSGRMLLAATQALGSGDSATARNWLDRADALGIDPNAVARLRAEMESARIASVEEDRSRLLALANQRIAQGRLVEPANDSARHYVDLLRAADPGYEGLADTEALLASRLLDDARRLGSEGRIAEAERRLLHAEAAGAAPAELSALRRELAATRQLNEAASETLPESRLNRTVHRPASYPQRARERGIEGWVEVEFTVGADGATRDPVITAAEPAGVFDDAVLEAIGAWRYDPRTVAGKPVDQRVQARIRFQLGGR
jgi:TonB family protein